jgi:hypothetical protein
MYVSFIWKNIKQSLLIQIAALKLSTKITFSQTNLMKSIRVLLIFV